MKAEVKSHYPIIVIDELKFDKSVQMPHSAQLDLVRKFNEMEVRADEDGWLDEFQEAPLRTWWQDHGYYNVRTSAESRLIQGDSRYQHVSVLVHVEEEIQYRLSGIRFVNADPGRELTIPAEQLRRVVQIRDGEILNVDAIRSGIEVLTKFYGTKGYMDFTAEPILKTDDAHRRISVLMRLSEQVPYRIEKLDVLSQKLELEMELRSTIKAGDIYNNKLIENFFAEHRSELAPNAAPGTSIQVRRDVKAHTVNLLFDLRVHCTPETD